MITRVFVAAIFATLIGSLAAAEDDAAPKISAAFCGGDPDHTAFKAALATEGTPARLVGPSGHFPLGSIAEVEIDQIAPEEAPWRYFVYMRAADEMRSPQSPDVLAVSTDRAATKTRIQFSTDEPLRKGAERQPAYDTASVVLVACDAENTPHAVSSLVKPVSTWEAGFVAVIAAIAIAGLVTGAAATKISEIRNEARSEPVHWGVFGLFVDFRNRMSLSRFQIFYSSFFVFIGVAYVFGRTQQLTDLSEDILWLMGIAAAGGIGGILGDVQKNRLSWDNWSWLKNDMKAYAPEHAPGPRLYHLVSTQKSFDIYRFQALVFTLFAVPGFVFSSVYSLHNADIPQGILYVLGMSQVAYVGAKVAVQPTVEDFNESVQQIRDLLANGEKIPPKDAARLIPEFGDALGLEWNPKSIVKHDDGFDVPSELMNDIGAGDGDETD